MQYRKIIIKIATFSPGLARSIKFVPLKTSGIDDSVLLMDEYIAHVGQDGVGEIDLPVRETGAVGYRVSVPAMDHPTKVWDKIEFNLSAGDPIDLSELIEAGQPPSDSLQEYVDQKIAEALAGGGRKYLEYSGKFWQSGTDAPNVQELESGEGVSLYWTRTGQGEYRGTPDVSITDKELTVQHYLLSADGSKTAMSVWDIDFNYFVLRTYNNGVLADDVLANSFIDMRLYPTDFDTD